MVRGDRHVAPAARAASLTQNDSLVNGVLGGCCELGDNLAKMYDVVEYAPNEEIDPQLLSNKAAKCLRISDVLHKLCAVWTPITLGYAHGLTIVRPPHSARLL